MSGHDDELTRLLAAVAEEEPPRGLRERALTAANDARPEVEEADPWRRLWESRPLRLAWAIAVALLLAANVVSRTGSPSHPRTAAPVAAAKEHQDSHELQAIVALPGIRLGGSGINTPEGRAGGPHVPAPKAPHHDTEDKS